MKLLILGGTKFLGRHLTEAALTAGHEVTLFNRGQTNTGLFPDVEQLHGDRDTAEGLAVLAGRRWDAVVDTSGYIPRHVRDSATVLKDAVEHYTFISTISVYANDIALNADESAALQTLADPTVEVVTGESYGGLKVLCEQAAEQVMPGRVLHVRSGLIVGPHDHTDRFTYWPVRVSQGGEMLTPGSPAAATQFVDARDQAAWIIRMAEAHTAGIFNLTGPSTPCTLGDVLATSQTVSGSSATFTWVSEEFLAAQQVAPWADIPCWLPDADNNMQKLSINKALEKGFTTRPLAETIADTLAWFTARPDPQLRAGISRQREAELLAAWKQQRSASN
ncbi:MAG: NAD-dependent epimerase/dehydratase family protein [Anaerolineae bacterium]